MRLWVAEARVAKGPLDRQRTSSSTAPIVVV